MITTDRTIPAETPVRHRADEVAAAVFGVWATVGLFLDGWAHRAGKPESFFTPWHGVLYSAFVCGALWFGGVRYHRARHGRADSAVDPLVVVGFALFAVSGLADMVWHTIFGIEQDLAALLSPVHLLLMGAGLLIVTTPVRIALGYGDEPRRFTEFAPAALGIMSAVALVSFFLQFASALTPDHQTLVNSGEGDIGYLTLAHGVASILLTNALLLGALAWVLARWSRPPVGTFTVLFAGTALLMAGLDGFDHLTLVVPVAVGGAVADAWSQGSRPPWMAMVVTPLVMWLLWVATARATHGLTWEPEIWGGAVVLATLTGGALHMLTSPGATVGGDGRPR